MNKDRPLNILLFPTRFYPAISGGDFYLQRLGEEFQKKHYKYRDPLNYFPPNRVTFLSSDAIDFAALRGAGKTVSPTHKHFTSYHNLKIQRFNGKQIGKENLHYQKMLRMSQTLLGLSEETTRFFLEKGPLLPELIDHLDKRTTSLLFENIPEVIHCSYLPYATLLYALILAKILDIPAVVTPFLHDANARYQDDAIFHVLGMFDAIIACTEYEKQTIGQHNVSSKIIHVLPMGIDHGKFQRNYKPLIRKNYQIFNQLVLFVGYKNHEKGALTLLNTIPSIISKNSDVSFMFIGPPTLAFNLTLKKIKKSYPEVQIINLTPENLSGIYDSQKIGAFQLADIFVMPSRSDAYGIVYLEAWAAKTPVIAANFPAMQEVINEKKDGILVEFDNTENLCDEILSLLASPEKRQQMGENGYVKIQKQNNWYQITSQTLNIYRSLKNE
ncbi:MAG: glycosyltransferase family 4 protein [Promethearchaeota archaeon]